MTPREQYNPGPARGAEILKDGDNWTLVVTRDLHHSPEKVWQALTDPAQLREWCPFDADASLAATGNKAHLTTVGAPGMPASETTVKRADPPRLLEYNWGGFNLRWELAPTPTGTHLRLFHNIAKPYISMGAAGWHICLDVLDHLIAGDPLGRMVGPDAMKFGGWQRLNGEYAAQFGIELPKWNPPGA